MSDKVFVDSNVLIYAHDIDAGKKHDIAAAAIQDLWRTRDGVVSTQVLEEFYVNVTRKIQTKLSLSVARDIVVRYAVWHLVEIGIRHIRLASEIQQHQRLSFWDALIVASAHLSGAGRILSEDFSHGRRIHDIVIENPFK